ncbi:MAG: CapA family protein [bacterium]|nr:CapA family protein [bacterium]MDT8396891.1 CapA family protein [bacterium]
MKRFFLPVGICAIILFSPAISPAQGGAPLRIALLGDFLPAGSAQPVIDRYGYARLFDGVREILATTDAVVLNLETPLTTSGNAVEGKTYTFRASPEAAAAMKAEGVQAAWLANNHILDFGVEALADTIFYMEEAGISHAGAGMDVGSAYSPALLKLKDRIALLLGYSNTFPESYWARKARPGTAFGSPKAVARGVAAADQAADGPVIASFHWGAELMTEPKDYQVELARVAVDSGASLVVGHHPHVPQPIDVYRGAPVMYSLGNFSFGSLSKRSRVGILAVAQFTEGGRCELLEIYPLLVDNYEVNFTPRPITGLDGQRIFDPLVKGIGREVASAEWDGQKGVIIPMQPTRGHRDAETRGESGDRVSE